MILLLTIIYNLLAIIANKGIPESISATSYILKPWLFTAYCLLTAGVLMPQWLEASSDSLCFLVFISCGGMVAAGVTPYFFKDKFEGRIHYIAGIVSFISYLVWMICSGSTLIYSLLAIILLILLDKRNYVYYTEIVSLITLALIL